MFEGGGHSIQGEHESFDQAQQKFCRRDRGPRDDPLPGLPGKSECEPGEFKEAVGHEMSFLQGGHGRAKEKGT